jgi:hypothetical protein
MLMSMEQKPRLVFKKIAGQAVKPCITTLIPFMNSPGGIVRDEDVHGRESRQVPANLGLLMQKWHLGPVSVSRWLQGSVQAPKSEATERFDGPMKVNDGSRERAVFVVVMIASHGEDSGAVEGGAGFKDKLIRHITAGKNEVDLAHPMVPMQVVKIGYDQ